MERIVNFFVRLFVRWMPDALTVAILLTLFTVLCAIAVAGYPPARVLESWGDGFWNLLTFTNQITLTFLFGYVVANTAPMQRALLRIADLAGSTRQAYAMVALVTGTLALFSWGLSLVSAGLMARAVGESCRSRGIRVHYPLLVASAFSGFVIWHQGISSSIGLAIATPGHFLEEEIGLIGTDQTIFTLWNLLTALVVLAVLPFLMASLHPRQEAEVREIDLPPDTATSTGGDESTATPARFLERSPAISLPIVAMGVAYLVVHFFVRGRGLELNILNFGFLVLGLGLAGSALRYSELTIDGGRVASPFLLQYPFYAGIAGIMADSGLAEMVVQFFVRIADADTLPFFAFLSGGLLNIFIPSGGGQWAVQGPIMMPAAMEVGADLPRVAMAVAFGDQWTNLVQPLILIPVITLGGIPARDFMGYLFVALFVTGAIFSGSLLLF